MPNKRTKDRRGGNSKRVIVGVEEDGLGVSELQLRSVVKRKASFFFMGVKLFNSLKNGIC